jgi:hypothetical protein
MHRTELDKVSKQYIYGVSGAPEPVFRIEGTLIFTMNGLDTAYYINSDYIYLIEEGRPAFYIKGKYIYEISTGKPLYHFG